MMNPATIADHDVVDRKSIQGGPADFSSRRDAEPLGESFVLDRWHCMPLDPIFNSAATWMVRGEAPECPTLMGRGVVSPGSWMIPRMGSVSGQHGASAFIEVHPLEQLESGMEAERIQYLLRPRPSSTYCAPLA